MLTIELHTRDIPETYARFAKEIGERHWKHRAAALKQEVKGNPFLERLHLQDDAITFQLEHLRAMQAKFGGVPVAAYNDHEHFPGASFAAQVLSVLDASDAMLADRFRGRVRGAFRNPAEMRAMRLELMTATHFLRAARKVSWPEMSSAPVQGVGVADLLIEDLGPNGLEVECKSFSEEKGRRIGRRQALEFYWLLKSRHWDRLQRIKTGVLAVVTVPRSVPHPYKERVALVDAVARCVLHYGPGKYEEQGARVTVSELDVRRLAGMPAGASVQELRDVMDQLTGTRNKETVVIATPRGGAVVLAVQSEEDDTLLHGIFETLRSSASRQFSGTRAGMFVAGLDGLTTEQMLDIAQRDQDPSAVPTGLRMHTSRFLESANRDFLVGVTFLSASSLRPSVSNVQDSGGTAYYFPKKDTAFWSDDFSGIFGSQAAEIVLP
jgi:hypothetical protein